MSQPTPADCHHSFPDPYPAPLTHIGNCRHCDTSYQDARAAMNSPTIAQLHNLTDRAQRGPLTADETARLREGINQLEALQAVARGYCPACGRGDAAPTVEDWEQERQRAETAEGRLHHLQASSEAAGILLTRTTDERDRLRGAVDRVRALHQAAECVNVRCKLKQWCIGCDPDGIEGCDENPWPCPTIRALDQPGPAATQATEPDTSARPWSTCTVPADHAPHPWHDPWPLPHGQDAHCPGRPTPDPKEQL